MKTHLSHSKRTAPCSDHLRPVSRSAEEVLIASSLLDLVRLRIALLRDKQSYANLLRRTLVALGEMPQRIGEIAAWRDSALFNEKERVALLLAESLVARPGAAVPRDVIRDAKRHFNEGELMQLVLTIFSANDWCDHEERTFRSPGARFNAGAER